MKFGVCSAIENISKAESMGFDYLETNASKLAGLSEEEFYSNPINYCTYPHARNHPIQSDM